MRFKYYVNPPKILRQSLETFFFCFLVQCHTEVNYCFNFYNMLVLRLYIAYDSAMEEGKLLNQCSGREEEGIS